MARRALMRGRRACLPLAAGVWLVLSTGVWPAAGQQGGNAAPGAGGDGTGKPVPLVNADDELIGYLEKAKALVKDGQYDRAIEALQALVMRTDSCFVPGGGVGQGQQFVSLRIKANEAIGQMGPEGLRRYRALYDPQAQRLYEEAAAACDAPALRRLADRYLHTTHGPAALEALGAVHFDRARFAQAARCWTRLRRTAPPTGRAEALLLAKIAAAYHFAGESDKAKEVADELSRLHPEAAAVLGGRQEDLVKFVTRVRSMPPQVGSIGPQARGRWPGLGGLPGGIGWMDDCDVVLAPRWSQPAQSPAEDDALAGRLVALGGAIDAHQQTLRRYGNRYRTTLRRSGGHVRLGGTYGGAAREVVLPSAVRPVVVGDQVVCRWEDAVVAFDLITGQRIWQTLAGGLPMARTLQGNPAVAYHPFMAFQIADRGRYGLTVGGGKIFTVYNFRPDVGSNYALTRMLQQQPDRSKEFSDDSVLAAILIEKQGYLQWSVGRGKGEGPLAMCKFLTAPAYDAALLYVLAVYMEHYHLLCLDAEDGALRWESVVSQVPAVTSARFGGYNMGLDHIGSAPAVADGMVYALTNAGVVAGFDADSGQAVWAYQYKSSVAGLLSTPRVHSSRQGLQLSKPGNPVLVSGGRVICLPADGDQVLALAADDGKLLWDTPRNGMHDLSALPGDRVLLSGPGLVVLNGATGKEDFASADARDIAGRPAVTRSAAYASGAGKVYRLDLKDYSLSTTGLMAPEGLLGNLLSVDGKLIAANAAGICGYFSYAEARTRLTNRLEAAAAADRAGLLLQRAQMAFNARRFDESLTDLEAARRLLEQHPNSLWSGQLPARFYRVHVALGNHAQGPEMLRRFDEALTWARSDQEKAHMRLRIAKCHERAGRLPDALAAAQQISEAYPEEKLVDVPIGASVDDTVLFGPDRAKVTGKVVAQKFIRRVIADYPAGRSAYAAFDAQAKAALDAARAAGDPDAMVRVQDRWPNSVWADRSLYAAAESYYRRAVAAQDGEAQVLFRKAREHLFTIAGMQDSALRLAANVALAVIWARGGKPVLANLSCGDILDMNPDMQTEVAFADVRGTLKDLLPVLRSGKLPRVARHVIPAAFASVVQPPLKMVFALENAPAIVLRDQEYRPVRLGPRVLTLIGGRAVMLDTAAENAEQSKRWGEALTSVDTAELGKRSYYPPSMRLVGGLSTDQKVAVVADRGSLVCLDVNTAKQVHRQKLADLGLGSFGVMGVGEGLFVAADTAGKVVCLTIADGQVRWKATLGGHIRNPYGPPEIESGVVLMRSNSGRTMTCFDAVTGKVLQTWEGKTYLEGRVSRHGLVVTLIDGELAVHGIEHGADDRVRLDALPGTRKYEAGGWPMILAIGDGRVAVSPSTASQAVEVVSMASGKQIASLEPAPIGTTRATPVDAWFEGKALFVVCAKVLTGRRRHVYGQVTRCRGLNVQRFDLDSGERSWSRDIDADAKLEYEVMPATVGQKHVVVLAKDRQSTGPFSVYVLDSDTGETREKLDVDRAADGGANDAAERRRSIGPPVMTNGRLCVETQRGVAIYGKQ